MCLPTPPSWFPTKIVFPLSFSWKPGFIYFFFMTRYQLVFVPQVSSKMGCPTSFHPPPPQFHNMDIQRPSPGPARSQGVSYQTLPYLLAPTSHLGHSRQPRPIAHQYSVPLQIQKRKLSHNIAVNRQEVLKRALVISATGIY